MEFRVAHDTLALAKFMTTHASLFFGDGKTNVLGATMCELLEASLPLVATQKALSSFSFTYFAACLCVATTGPRLRQWITRNALYWDILRDLACPRNTPELCAIVELGAAYFGQK